MPKYRTVHAFSAGGVVFRRVEPAEDSAAGRAPQRAQPQRRATPQPGELATGERVEIALVGRPREDFWVLPKGTPNEGESHEQVALREVREETGLETRIVGKIGSINYWFTRQGTRYQKEVLYYLMEATGGDVALHDHEYDEARWFPFDEGVQRLTYDNETDIAWRADPLIAQYLDGDAPSAQ